MLQSFMSKWYNEGIETEPPPCLKSHFFYLICSGNRACYYLGLMGTKWGAKYRSQIFFVQFWLSVAGMAMLCAAVACLSVDSTSIMNVPFFQGSLDIIENGITAKVDYYAGIARMVFRDCTAGALCPPESIGWGDDSCDRYFSNCHVCKFSPNDVSVPLAMSLLGQFGQIVTDLNRSTPHFDLHCQKGLGLFAGVMGMIGNLSALATFGGTCMHALHTNDGVATNFTKQPGAALILLIIGTMLRVVDIWAHIIVPVHEEDFWKPGEDNSLKGSKKSAAGTPADANSTSGSGVVGMSIRDAQTSEDIVNPVWAQSDAASRV